MSSESMMTSRNEKRVENEVRRSRDRARLCTHKGEEEDDEHSGYYREVLNTYRILCSYTSGIVGSS
jgi:hypothetical protein